MLDSSNGNSDLSFLLFFLENGNLRGCSLRFGRDKNGRIALFQIVLGLTPRRRPCKACPSQNDDFFPRFGINPLQTALQGTSIPKRFGTTLFRSLCGPFGWSLWHFPPLCCSSRWSLWPIPVFLICHIRMKNGLSRTFSSGRVTLGNP